FPKNPSLKNQIPNPSRRVDTLSILSLGQTEQEEGVLSTDEPEIVGYLSDHNGVRLPRKREGQPPPHAWKPGARVGQGQPLRHARVSLHGPAKKLLPGAPAPWPRKLQVIPAVPLESTLDVKSANLSVQSAPPQLPAGRVPGEPVVHETDGQKSQDQQGS